MALGTSGDNIYSGPPSGYRPVSRAPDEDQRDRSPEDMDADVGSVYSIERLPSVMCLIGLPTNEAVPNLCTLGETDREGNEEEDGVQLYRTSQ